MKTRFECCPTMMALSSSSEDWEDFRSELEDLGEVGDDFPSPSTMVEFNPDLKSYFINNVAIYFCPWCAAKLPEPQMPADAPDLGSWDGP